MTLSPRELRSQGTPAERRVGRWILRIVIAGLLIGGLLAVFRVLGPTPEEGFAAFDAARAIPDGDNAAILYAQLLQGEEVPLSDLVVKIASLHDGVMDPISARDFRTGQRQLRELVPPGEMDANLIWFAASHAWKSAEHPELKSWLNAHGRRIDKMLEAARRPSCRFWLSPGSGQMGLFDVPLGAVRQNVLLVRAAASNDLGEGDVDAALAKWRALMAIGRHLRDQPTSWCLVSGIAVEAAALGQFKELAVEGPCTDRQFQVLSTECERGDRPWVSLSHEIDDVRALFSRVLKDRRPLGLRVCEWCLRIWGGGTNWADDRCRELYHRMLSDRRGVRILIELRGFKDRTGGWPQRLDQIASTLPPGFLIDPINGCAYVYKPVGDGFSLYSTGPNQLDENGRHMSSGPDDWPIWPPKGRTPEP